jgi:hypothetical protein
MSGYFTRLRIYTIISLLLLGVGALYLVRHTRNVDTPPPFTSLHCVGVTANFACSMNYFELLTKTYGPRIAMEHLKLEYNLHPEIVSNCHQLSHVIGNTAVDRYEGNIAKAFKDGDSFCWSGYYHGVVERAVKEISEETFIANADLLCAAIPGKDRYSFDYYNCVHGLGHGIMALKDDEVFASLPLCDHLHGEWERKSCYGGVFMENIMVDNRTHTAKNLKKDDLMYPCNTVETAYKEQCYLMQTSYALSQNNYDFKSTFALCAGVDAAFRDTCAQSIGRDASGSTVSDVQKTIAYCSLGQDENQQKNCVIGAVKDFISYFHGDGQAQMLCSTLPTPLQETCNETRMSYLKTL